MYIYNFQKTSILNKLPFIQKIMTNMYHGFHKTNIKQHNCLQQLIDDNYRISWAPNQQMILMSERSCDTEDCSNGFWKCSVAITEINYIL